MHGYVYVCQVWRNLIALFHVKQKEGEIESVCKLICVVMCMGQHVCKCMCMAIFVCRHVDKSMRGAICMC